MDNQIKKDIRYLNIDGIFAHMYATLTGGIFLTGFAIHLGMNELMIGMLASLPFIATWFQLPTSFYIYKHGRRKSMVYFFSAFARATWIPILVVALLPLPRDMKPKAILVLMFFAYTFASISQVSWLSWMSDLIPDNIRGKFFGTRNMYCSAAGIVIMLVFSRIIDRLNTRSLSDLPVGFVVAFISAVSFGMVAVYYLRKISEPTVRNPLYGKRSFYDSLGLPFRDSNFRRFLTYAFLWSFSVHLASPFLTLYFLRDLHFSYLFVAVLSTISALSDMIGMRIWGSLSDRVKNKAVIQFAAQVAIFIPLAWATVKPGSRVVPVILHILAGGFWAGINLCTNNLLLRISGEQDRAVYLSLYNIIGGIGAALSPLLAGLFLKSISGVDLHLLSWKVFPIQIVLIGSTLFRLLSFQVFTGIREPEEGTVKDIIRILKSVRGMNVSDGFSYLLHPFFPVEEKDRD